MSKDEDQQYIDDVDEWKAKEKAEKEQQSRERSAVLRTIVMVCLFSIACVAAGIAIRDFVVPSFKAWRQEAQDSIRKSEQHLRDLEEAQSRCIQMLGVDTCFLLEERALKQCIGGDAYDVKRCVEGKVRTF